MQTKLFIPTKLKVGFQQDETTYSEKLAYVIYYDQKGVLRKENSWKGWVHHPGDKGIDGDILSEDFDPYDFDNTPMTGFILNRNVGGVRQSYGHNARVEKVRVFDPRGFEIEIDLPNLLFILQECDSTKGKGLEGEFVYAWSGKNLVLLPTHSLEYQESMKHTKRQDKKVTKSDMVEGCRYTFKSGESAIYLGRHESYEKIDFRYNKPDNIYKKSHIFYTNEGDYLIEKGFTKIATKDTEIPDSDYAEQLEKFLKSPYHSKLDRLEIDHIPYSDKEINSYKSVESICNTYNLGNQYMYTYRYVIIEDIVYNAVINYIENLDKYLLRIYSKYDSKLGNIYNNRVFALDSNNNIIEFNENSFSYNKSFDTIKVANALITKEELDKITRGNLIIVLESGIRCVYGKDIL